MMASAGGPAVFAWALGLLLAGLVVRPGSGADEQSPAGPTVQTVAGAGSAEFSGDEGSALEAGVAGPFGVVLGPDGALYICEVDGHVVRRVDLETHRVSTIAGQGGRRGHSGDGGPAREALLNEPYEARFDAAGHLYVVDMQAAVVRRIDGRTGIITTVAGAGAPGFSGDGGSALQAHFRQPHAIEFFESQLLVCDIGNHRIRSLDLQSGGISTFAGDGRPEAPADGAPLAGAPLHGPRALAVDSEGGLFIALREGNRIYRVDSGVRVLKHVAGTGESGYSGDGGPAREARLAGPKGLSCALNGDVYLADTESHTVRVVRRATGVIETVLGDGREGDGPDGDPQRCRLSRPHGVFVDRAGRVFVGDSGNHKVRMLAPPAP